MKIKTILVALVLLSALTPAVLADHVITTKTTRDSMPGSGEPAGEEISTVWLGPNQLRENASDQSVIVDLDASKLYVLKHDTKSYHAIDLPVEWEKLLPPEMAPMVEQMEAQLAMEVLVTPTEEKRKIGEWNSTRYDVKLKSPMGMQMDMTIWAAKESGIDMASYKRLMMQLATLQPGMDWIQEVLSIDGFPVLRETSVVIDDNTVGSRDELVSIETKEAPAGNWSPPGDYTEEPFDLVGGLTGG